MMMMVILQHEIQPGGIFIIGVWTGGGGCIKLGKYCGVFVFILEILLLKEK